MWEQIQANRRRSAVLITGMALVLIALGYVAGELILGPGGGIFGTGFALILWGIMMAVYFSSAESVLLLGTHARELQREDSPRLFNIVDEMKLASGLTFTPRIFLIDDPSPNAFAVGRKPETSAVAVTTGLVHRLSRDELQGVIAHELGHLKNRDVQFMTLAAVMLGSIVILAEIVRRWMWYGGRNRRRSNSRGGGQGQIVILVIALVFAILGPLMAQLLYFACSRKREFLADASAAQFTRYPEGLASALEKIATAASPVAFASKATAPMFIVNPLAAAGGGAGSLFATHPPTSERIQILRAMTGASLADYETAYRRAAGGSLLSPATIKGGESQGIRAPSDEGPVETQDTTRSISHRLHGYLRLPCACGLEISVPEGYEQDSIRCVRCGSVLPIPVVTPSMPAAVSSQAPPVIAETAPVEYTRTGSGWESFRCACGRTVQLSPGFSAPFVRCNNCGRQIAVTSPRAA